MRLARAIIFILICIGLLWLAVLLIRSAFSSGKSPETTQVKIVKYAQTNAATELYIDGPVVASQDHNALRITVDRSETKVERITGYDGQVTQLQAFPNSEASYAAFLSSLEKLNFARGNNSSELKDDRGYCPLGNRYVYTLHETNTNIIHYWTTSCGGGTFGGNHGQVRTLFLRQIPTKTLNEVSKNFAL